MLHTQKWKTSNVTAAAAGETDLAPSRANPLIYPSPPHKKDDHLNSITAFFTPYLRHFWDHGMLPRLVILYYLLIATLLRVGVFLIFFPTGKQLQASISPFCLRITRFFPLAWKIPGSQGRHSWRLRLFSLAQALVITVLGASFFACISECSASLIIKCFITKHSEEERWIQASWWDAHAEQMQLASPFDGKVRVQKDRNTE